jgi:hypothetical protein
VGQALLHRNLLVSAAAALLLLRCDGMQREQAAAAKRQRELDGLVSRCRQQQPAVNQQLQELSISAANLSRLNQQTYSPLPRPAVPNPEQLVRFTREDQELELQRYEQALSDWRSNELLRRGSWQDEQEAQRQRSTERQQLAKKALLAQGVGGTEAARKAWSSCDPQQLAAVKLD